MKIIILLFAALCGVGYYFYQDFDRTRKEQEATIADLRRQLGAPAPAEKKNWLQDRIANRVSPLEGSSYDRHVGVWTAPTVYPAGSSGSSAYYYDTTGRYWIDQYGRRQYTPSR